MRPHSQSPRARTAPSRSPATRPASRRSLDDGVGAGDGRSREHQPSDLAIDVRQDLPRPLVSVAGELDLATVGLLTATLDHVRRNVHRRTRAGLALEDVAVDVDLSAVTFADSHGLAPVMGNRTRVIAASRVVWRVLLALRGIPLAPPSSQPGRQPMAAGGVA